MGIARLGNLSFRLDPEQISYAYQVDYTTIDTIGGQVVQVLGSTIGDITIQGSFGEDHGSNLRSWQLAESFHSSIKAMIDAQTLPAPTVSSGGTPKPGSAPVHKPINFSFQDGVHNWDMLVMIKGITDPDSSGSIEHTAAKSNYHYTLTLFLVADSSLHLQGVTTDQFISRMAAGLGWSSNDFNGAQTIAAAIQFIQANSADGTYAGFAAALLEGKVTTAPTAAAQTNNTPGTGSTPQTRGQTGTQVG